jgi:muramoyltetrapeptide carboxypeptidase
LDDRRFGKPTRLRAGDTVGVVAPSGAVEEARLDAGVRALESWGFRVVLGAAARRRRGYLAGSDAERLHDLQTMLDAPEVRAIFCARGGYGSQRLIPRLDLQGLVHAPKAVVGYSDATALLTAIGGAGLVAFHGPMVASDLARGISDRSTLRLQRMLSDPSYTWELEVPVGVRPGRAEGRLVGGCLSVLASTLGTPWAIEPAGCILFLEDVHEWPYRLDRLLTQLRQTGKLDRLAGLVFGTMAGCRVLDGIGALDVVRELFEDAPYPVGFGTPAGHDPAATDAENLVLPLGIQVLLEIPDDGPGRLSGREPAVL